MTTQISKPILHFVHGNSFPAGTYGVFLKHLRAHYEAHSLEMHGHNPLYPVTDGWPFLVQELIDTLTKDYQQPVIMVGHSLGGILAFMVASLRPDLVRCVVVLDSPLVAGWRALMLRGSKKIGLDKKFSPARFSEKRRTLWKDTEEAYQHFASKEMFAIWPPEVLRDYMQFGLQPHPEGVTLRFTREIESQIYLTLPHHLGNIARRGLKVPVGFVGGTESVECRQAGLEATKKLVGKHFIKIPGGHLIPMEVPMQTATAVHEMICSFNLKDLP
ncbi:MAG: alpha/beta hydrolase [Undibacterium sp.]|nr:alpha/beta hydrolase [Undibacterium sp.]